jgi:exonuclease SbcC
MKFLYFGDKHERRTAPENRLDNYFETQKAKTREIIQIGKSNRVSAFLQPGDFFDTPNPGNEFVSEIAGMWGGGNAHDLLSKFRSGLMKPEEVLKAMNDYIPMIGVAGNHELFGNNLNTLDKTAIGLLNKWGLMRFATKDKPYVFHTEDGLKIAITGTHYHLDIDTHEHLDDYIVEEKLGDFHIHIVHGMLSDKNMGKFVRHTLLDQIKHTKADLTISGHDHIGFPLTEIDGKWFVNPGAVPRMSNDLKEIARRPKVLMIDITKEHGIKLEDIYLKSAPQGEMVLNRKKIEERKQRDARLEEFKKAVKDVGMKKSTDIMAIIRDLADSKQVSSTMKEDLLNRVGDKKAEMSQESESVVKDAWITKIVMENFQSHAYTELDFKDGFNILVGESGQGKTSVLRAINWVYENKPSGKGVIRRGSDYAKVIIYLSNGYIITRYAEAKKGGKNGYEIVDPDTGAIEFHNTKILPEVQKLLGFSQLVIDKDLQFNLNFMKQGTGWFLIGDNYPAPQKAKILGSIYGVQYADSVIREFDQEERKVNDTIKKSNEELQKIDEKIGEYEYLESVGESIENMEWLLEQIEELEQRKSKIQDFLEKRKQQEAIIKENESILQSLSQLPQIKEELLKVKQQELHRNQLEKAIHTYHDVKKKYDMTVEMIERTNELHRAKKGLSLTQESLKRKEEIEEKIEKRKNLFQRVSEEKSILEATNHLSELVKDVKVVQQLVSNHEKLAYQLEQAKGLEEKQRKTLHSLTAIKETLEKTEHVAQAKVLFTEMKQLATRQEVIQKSVVTHTRYVKMTKKESEIIAQQKTEIKQYAERYKELLEQEGACPTCFGTIDSNTAKRIASKYQ